MIIEGMQSLIIKATSLAEAAVLEKQIYNQAIQDAINFVSNDGPIGEAIARAMGRKLIK